MKLEVLAISKLKDPSLKSLCAEYINRINNFNKIDFKEISPTTKLSETSHLVLLDEHGKEYSSIEFAKWVQKTRDEGSSKITFVIGGDNGFPEEYLNKKHIKISLSKMTLQHDLARLIFLEQLYRAFTIINRHPYHRV